MVETTVEDHGVDKSEIERLKGLLNNEFEYVPKFKKIAQRVQAMTSIAGEANRGAKSIIHHIGDRMAERRASFGAPTAAAAGGAPGLAGKKRGSILPMLQSGKLMCSWRPP